MQQKKEKKMKVAAAVVGLLACGVAVTLWSIVGIKLATSADPHRGEKFAQAIFIDTFADTAADSLKDLMTNLSRLQERP